MWSYAVGELFIIPAKRYSATNLNQRCGMKRHDIQAITPR